MPARCAYYAATIGPGRWSMVSRPPAVRLARELLHLLRRYVVVSNCGIATFELE